MTRTGSSERARRRPAGRAVPARQLRRWASYTALVLVALAFMSPLLYMVSTSLKPPGEVFATPPTLIGSELRFSNYVEALSYAPFGRFFLNSFIVAAAGTTLNVAVSIFAGYAFSRLRWRGRNVVFAIFIGTLIIPQDVLVIPIYIMMQGVGWINTLQALIIPWAFTALGAFLLRQFFLKVPQELEDAARIDGAGTLRTFFAVMLPLARPTVAVLFVFVFIGYWNSFLWPLVAVRDVNTLGTVPLGLQQFLGQQGYEWHLVMAASTVSMLPTIIILLALQRYLVRGIMTSGMGGR